MILPGSVVAVDFSEGSPPTALARPKSSTLTFPSGVILILPGFKSRWTTPLLCAAATASATCKAIDNASSNLSGFFAIRSTNVSPGTYSRIK